MGRGPARADGVVLETHGIVKEFGGFRAVDGVDVRLVAGTVHALVGPNGAGKTSLFNLLTGFLAPTAGRIVLFGDDITGLGTADIARRGVARSFQITSLFEELTALEHVVLALQSPTAIGFRFWSNDAVLRRFEPRGREILAEVGLETVAASPVRSLSYGRKRALELALALALDPQLLLLDEPTAGMGAEDVQRTIDLIQHVRASRTVLLVEHNMGVVEQLSDHVIVMQAGRVIADGVYAEVRRDARVITAYLGTSNA